MAVKLDESLANLDVIESYCKECNRETNHFILFQKVISVEDYPSEDIYMVIQCCGCENIGYRSETRDIPFENEFDPYVSSIIYPSVIENHIKLVDENDLPEKLSIIYLETLDAFAAQCFLLAAAGFRAIIEAMCDDLKIKGNLDEKIRKLEANQIITAKYAKRLHSIRFLGNDSIHNIEVPDIFQLKTVLEIIEHLLYDQYCLDTKVENDLTVAISTVAELKKEVEHKIRYKKKKLLLKVEGFTLKELLSADYKRIIVKTLENELVSQIQAGTYIKLSILRTEVNSNNSPIHFYTIPT